MDEVAAQKFTCAVAARSTLRIHQPLEGVAMSAISVFGHNAEGLSFSGTFIQGLSGLVFWQASFTNRGVFLGKRSGQFQSDASDDGARTMSLALEAMENAWGAA